MGGAPGKGLFPDNVIHLGGDEVNTACWTKSPSITAWLKAQGFTNPNQGYQYFVARVQALAQAMGRDVVGWNGIWDNFGTELAKGTIIHKWIGDVKSIVDITSAGYRVLWSVDSPWYLDSLGTTWQTEYVQEPCTGLNDAQCALVLGGGGEMWGETVDTSDILQTIWPRMGAIAERLWSPRAYNDTAAAAPRYGAFRCLLNRRGVAAAPAKNSEARTSPPGPGGCLSQ